MNGDKPKKKWAKGAYAKKIEFRNGGSILKLSLKAADFVTWLEDNVNEKGYVNLVIAELRQPDKFENTHEVYLDQYRPQHQGDSGQSRQQPPARTQYSRADDFPPDDMEPPF